MTIHKEGYASLGLTVAVLFALNAAMLFFFPEQPIVHQVTWVASGVFFLVILQFFRSPSINPIENDGQVLAPADGKVVVIEETKETEYFGEERIQVSIFMSPINVHVNRNPVSGKVKYFKYHPGKYLVAWHPKSSTDNERTTIVVENPKGVEVLFRQIAGALARRIRWYVQEGDHVQQGAEFGFIKFGSRVDVMLPKTATVKVNLNDKTVAGKTVIAEL